MNSRSQIDEAKRHLFVSNILHNPSSEKIKLLVLRRYNRDIPMAIAEYDAVFNSIGVTDYVKYDEKTRTFIFEWGDTITFKAVKV